MSEAVCYHFATCCVNRHHFYNGSDPFVRLQASTAAGRRDSAHNYEEIIRQQSSIDQIKARIDRIERRLEIAG